MSVLTPFLVWSPGLHHSAENNANPDTNKFFSISKHTVFLGVYTDDSIYTAL